MIWPYIVLIGLISYHVLKCIYFPDEEVVVDEQIEITTDEVTLEDMVLHDMTNEDNTYDIGVIDFNE